MPYLGQEPGKGKAQRWIYTAKGGETKVVQSDTGVPLNYSRGQLDVFLNGIQLVPEQDYIANNGSTITGLSTLANNDVVQVFALDTFNAANHYTKAETESIFGGKYYGNDGIVDPGGGNADIFRSHTNTLSSNTTIADNENAFCAGPLTIANNTTLSTGNNAVLTIL